jgi:tetratricopeptide (TPR) repeat protein
MVRFILVIVVCTLAVFFIAPASYAAGHGGGGHGGGHSGGHGGGHGGGHYSSHLFISVGGYWPAYPCARYYWYDCFPSYYYYNPAPVVYSYYPSYSPVIGAPAGTLAPGSVVNGVQVPDYDGLNAVAMKLRVQQQAAAQPPAPQQQVASQAQLPAPTTSDPNKIQPTESDVLFDQAVKSFTDANYPAACQSLQRAVRLEPSDTVLPFAYAQALFANNQYEQASAVIATVLNEMPADKADVFFPRGLYKTDALLTAQIKNLERAVKMNPASGDLQLLYGYQLLGTAQYDQALPALEITKKDPRLAPAADKLIGLLNKAKQPPQK